MNTPFRPEFGQMLFGQPSQSFAAPEILEAVFGRIDDELSRVMWNVNQEEYASPFSNSGNRFECDTFKVHAYDWGSDDQPWNFAWRDLRVSWYKYMGRGMSANMEVSPDLADMLYQAKIESARTGNPPQFIITRVINDAIRGEGARHAA